MRKIVIKLMLLFLIIVGNITSSELSEDKGEQVNEENKTSNKLLDDADKIFKSGDMETALKLYIETFETARIEFNRSVEVEALAQIARSKLKLNRKDEGRTDLIKAGERAEESDPIGWTRYLGVRGRFEWNDDDLVSARGTFTTMFEFAKTHQLWGRMIDAANLMSIVAEKPEEQIGWIENGIEAAEDSDNESMLAVLWNNMGATYYDQKNYGKALECYIKSREYHWRFSGELAKLYADYHIGMTHRLLGNHEEASRWLRPVLAWAERLENSRAIGQACEDLGEIEAIIGNKESALVLFQRARDEYKKEGYDQSWSEIWENINKRINDMKN
jgi:tetratricopeptide (TPR) repeat protein